MIERNEQVAFADLQCANVRKKESINLVVKKSSYETNPH